MKKALIVLMAVWLTAGLLAACGGNTTDGNQGAESSEPVKEEPKAETKENSNEQSKEEEKAPEPVVKGEITVATNRTDIVDTLLPEYEKRFKEMFPGVTKINFEAIKDYDKTIKIRMASGELPDVFLIPGIPNEDLPKYLAPLDDLGLNGKIYFQEYKSFDGKLYGISTGGASTGVVYNKAAYEKAGITSVPKTLDEFYAAAAKLKDAGIVPLATNYKDAWPLSEWRNVALGVSGDPLYLNNWIQTDTPFTVDSPIGQTLSVLKTMYEKGYVEPDIFSTNWEQSKVDVANGKFASFVLGNWAVQQVVDAGTTPDNVGFYPLPTDNSGTLKAMLKPDWFIGVSKDSDNAETAKAFVKWWIEESGYDDFAGFIPTLKSKTPQLPQLEEFMSMKPVITEQPAFDSKWIEIRNTAKIKVQDLAQEALVKDTKTTFDEYNKKWAEARAKVMNP